MSIPPQSATVVETASTQRCVGTHGRCAALAAVERMLTEFSWVSLAHAQRSVTEWEKLSQSSAGPSEAHQLRRQPSPVDPAEAAGAELRPLGQPVGDVARSAPRTSGPPICCRLNQWSRSGPRRVHPAPRCLQRRAAAWAAQGLVEDGRARKSSVRVPARRRNVNVAVPLPRDVPAPEDDGR